MASVEKQMTDSPWDSLNIKTSSEIEQQEAGMVSIAKLTATFYLTLTAEGVPSEYATIMTNQWLLATITGLINKG